MIGRVYFDGDVQLYLVAGEVEVLQKEALEGVLVRVEKPKRQGSVSLSINDRRSNEGGAGIGSDGSKYIGVLDDFHIDVFLGTPFYRLLLERGIVGLRWGLRDGSKIRIADLSKTEDYTDRSVADGLEFYKTNRGNLGDWLA